MFALTYMLTLEDPQRFPKSREVGCFLRLRPERRDSGESQPQMHISKEGDRYLRTILVQGAHYILGPFGADSNLRSWGLKLAARGGKKCKEASRGCGGDEISFRPTILAWDFEPSLRSLHLGAICAPWARIWKGSNSTFRYWSTYNGTTGPVVQLEMAPSLWAGVLYMRKTIPPSTSTRTRTCSIVTAVVAVVT
jgi:hypothetical protein